MKKILFTVTLGFLVFLVNAHAAVTLSAAISDKTVTVRLSGGSPGSVVTYTILAPNDSLPTGPFLQVLDSVTDASGDVSISFDLPPAAPTGTYRVKAYVAKTAYETSFAFTNTLLLTEINKTSDAADIQTLIHDFGQTVDLNMDHFYVLSDPFQLKVAQFILNAKGTEYATVADFVGKYNLACALVSLEASNASDGGVLSVTDTFRQYSDILGVLLDASDSDYNKLAEEAKATFRGLVAGKAYTDVSAVSRNVKDSLLLGFFKNAAWPGIQNYTELAASAGLGFDTGTKYQALNDKSIPLKAVVSAKGSLNTVADVNRVFNDAVAAAYSSQTGSDTSGSSGGGGGKGSGSGVTLGSDFINTNTAQPIENQPTVDGLTDLQEAEWAAAYIQKLYDENIVDGVGGNRFSPNAVVTREQFIKMMLSALKFDVKEGDSGFADVSGDAWYAKYIYTSKEIGLVKGISDTEFGIGREISRQDMAVMLYRAIILKGKPLKIGTELTYDDSDSIDGYAREAVRMMTANAIINGEENNRFSPTDSATRAAAAKVVCKTMDIMSQ